MKTVIQKLKERNILKEIKRMRLLTIREIKRIKSRLNGTANRYTIDGVSGYGVKTFLGEERLQINNLLTGNRQIKVYFAPSRNMERVDIKLEK